MKVTFKQGSLMELVFLITIMEISMKVLSKMVSTMETDSLCGQMECLLLAHLHKGTETQENLSNYPMVVFIKNLQSNSKVKKAVDMTVIDYS